MQLLGFVVAVSAAALLVVATAGAVKFPTSFSSGTPTAVGRNDVPRQERIIQIDATQCFGWVVVAHQFGAKDITAAGDSTVRSPVGVSIRQ